MNISYNCKICGKPGVAKADDNTPSEWLPKLSPLLTCNRCSDMRKELIDSARAIGRLCQSLVRMTAMMEDEEAASRQGKIRVRLIAETQKYAGAIAKLRGIPRMVWEMDFVDQLMAAPAKAGDTMHTYRRLLASAISEANPKPENSRVPYAD